LRKILVISGIAAVGALGGWLIHKYGPTSDDSPIGRAKDRVVDAAVALKDRIVRALRRPAPAPQA
jgi:hypothetical protein